MLTTIIALSVLQAAPGDTPLMIRQPAVYGDQVVFHYATDLWVSSKDGGPAKRLTSHVGMETNPRISPDGKWLMFAGQYDGPTPQIYIIPMEGGQPKRVTRVAEGATPQFWLPGNKIAFSSTAGSFTNRHQRMWVTDVDGGLPQSNEVFELSWGTASPDGSMIAYNRMNSYAYNWRRYRGGTQGFVSFYNLRTGEYSEMEHGTEQSYFPMLVGNNVYYASDKEQGTTNLYRYDMGSKRSTKLTNNGDGDITYPSTDGKTIAYERDGGISLFDIATGQVKPFVPQVQADVSTIRPTYRNFASEINEFSISPSGKRLAVAARGKTFSLPATSGDTRMLLGKSGQRESNVVWAPDGQHIAFMSDMSGEERIYMVPQRGGDPVMVDTPADHRISGFSFAPKGDKILYRTEDAKLVLFDLATKTGKEVYDSKDGLGGLDFSADGSWIAFSAPTSNFLNALFLYNVADGKLTQVTKGFFNEGVVAFDTTGKYIYLASSRNFGFNSTAFEIGMTQMDPERVYVITLRKDIGDPLAPPQDEEPLKDDSGAPAASQGSDDSGLRIDLDGMEDRMVALPLPNGNYPFLIGVANGVLTFTNGQIVKFDMNSKSVQPIIAGVGQIDVTPDRTKFAYRAGNTIGILDLRPGGQAGQGAVNTSEVGFEWDPRAEWTQMYWQAWRAYRDRFYDKNMLGLNWRQIGQKWSAMLPHLSSRSDLNLVLGKMVGEMGTGHAYVQGGDSDVQLRGAPIGKLGADFETVGNSVRFKRVIRGDNTIEQFSGPLGRPGVDVNDGDYLLAIDGHKVTADVDFHDFLVDKVGKAVVLTVNSRNSEVGARKVTVRPSGSESGLRYYDWVRANRAAVEAASGGRIGYVHVPDTQTTGITEFMRGYYGNAGKDAVVIDERYNGGGFLPTFYIEYLQRQVFTGLTPRVGTNIPIYPFHPIGPKVLMVNHYAGSGGDMFPWLFRAAELGPLLGTRTWGGLVGISGGVPFSDGGGVTVPAFGIYDVRTGEIIAENKGVTPDITVDWTPEQFKKGQDPQLDAAIKYLQDQLRRNPSRGIADPVYPRPGGN
ncbi:MAG: PD40 domain-containing protein [Fimbriimonadaceae bacterium]|nr:PD40 domain-containing protein [Fimbriimonadaceae bacterium]